MADRPLGISDLHEAVRLRYTPYGPDISETWYWCRVHSPEKGPERIRDGGGYYPTGQLPGDDCIRVGPFMSEREANRLSDDGTGAMGYTHDNPLGMEVER